MSLTPYVILLIREREKRIMEKKAATKNSISVAT